MENKEQLPTSLGRPTLFTAKDAEAFTGSDHEGPYVLIYEKASNLYIELRADGEFVLDIDRSGYSDHNLARLEKLLTQWGIGEGYIAKSSYGCHTPSITTELITVISALGLEFEDASWHNDETDSVVVHHPKATFKIWVGDPSRDDFKHNSLVIIDEEEQHLADVKEMHGKSFAEIINYIQQYTGKTELELLSEEYSGWLKRNKFKALDAGDLLIECGPNGHYEFIADAYHTVWLKEFIKRWDAAEEREIQRNNTANVRTLKA